MATFNPSISEADRSSCRLSPHEADDLDVILLGHSLGGILAADVALLQREGLPKHRILGLVNFDVPFLGLHPRVIPTGISGSIPKKDLAAEEKLAKEQESLGLDPTFKLRAPCSTFDPPFENDIRRVERGILKGMLHFITKNTDNLSQSIFDRVVSSYKFAGCVNNYSNLRRRYRRLVELEVVEYNPNRVRFVNYYTTSTGRIPRKQSSKPEKDTNSEDEEIELDDDTATNPLELSETWKLSHDENAITSATGILGVEPDTPGSKTTLSLLAGGLTHEKDQHLPEALVSTGPSTSIHTSDSSKPSNPIPTAITELGLTSELSKERLRKFILLPSHHWRSDANTHWVPLLMENMDEVTAHQSMFVPQGTYYDQLVGDCGALIEQWAHNDLSRRLLQETLD